MFCWAVCVDLRPFRLVEGEGFKHFLENIGIKLLHRNSMAGKTKEIRELTEGYIIDKLIDIKHVCLYIDHWTYYGEKYLSVFISYIENYENKYILLGFVPVPDKCSMTTFNEIGKIEQQFQLSGKISFINSDSAQDMVCVVKKLTPTIHLHCFSHRLHNTIIDSFKTSNLESITNKISKLVEDFNRSTSFYHGFTKYIKEKYSDDILNKVKTKMKKSVVARWSSLYSMINDFHGKYQYVKEYLESESKYNYAIHPNDSDYLMSKHILDVLSELAELQSVIMKNSIGNISKILYRIKYTYNRIVEISGNIIQELLIMVNEFTEFIKQIEKHFIYSGYMDTSNYESEKYILIIASWMNPLNVKELLISNTKTIILEELKTFELEQRMHSPKKRFYVNNTASDLFILSPEIESNEKNMDSFLDNIIEVYIDFTSKLLWRLTRHNWDV